MPRTSMVLAVASSLALLTTAAHSPASAAKYHYGFDNDEKNNGRDAFGWALVHDGHNSSSSLDDENLDEIKARYGGDLLYIRDGEDRYVIRDRRLMRRAEDSLKPIQEAGHEIGAAVGAKVSYSMRRSQGSREQARVARRIGRLSRRIARLSEEGEDTRDLETELSQLQGQLETMKEDRSLRHDDEEREADLEAATQRASRHMRDATRKVSQEMRDILREAKSRHLAETVED